MRKLVLALVAMLAVFTFVSVYISATDKDSGAQARASINLEPKP